MDIYIRDLHVEKWNTEQAETQYQGEGSSHELASLLVTEVIQHSLFTLKEPAYLLFLDARSAFDMVVPELLVRNMYLAGMNCNTTVYMDHRLKNRLTYLDWDKNSMGPICDEHGLEQGGPNSSDMYKLYNNEIVKTTQMSNQGVNMGSEQVISAIGQADDTVLTSNRLTSLSNILYLTTNYCDKFTVTLCPDKTRLLRISNTSLDNLEIFNLININGKPIHFSEEAKHVGIIRSSKGNLPNILNRIAAHQKALGGIMSFGIAKKRRTNPAVGLHQERVFGVPVLMSGLASLVLSPTDVSMLDSHYKETYQSIQKLHLNTPNCFIYFLGGCLPTKAVIHLKQLTLFGMVAQLHSDPLNIHARNILVSAKSSSKSWFCQIRDISLLYKLPHPLQILNNPPAKEQYKNMIKSHVVDYWETKLRGEASFLPSLKYFKPVFMSLCKPHHSGQQLEATHMKSQRQYNRLDFYLDGTELSL